jgi:hypothetical protein
MAQSQLSQAKKVKNDEFYTQWETIESEIRPYLAFNRNIFRDKVLLFPCDDPEWSNFTKYFVKNFNDFGLKKLISTSYAAKSKNAFQEKEHWIDYEPTQFERISPKFDKNKTETYGKIFVLDKNTNRHGNVDINDLKWNYLKGDGDFRSEEVRKLRDEADIIITNPPFSLFREFMTWIMEGQKQFLVIGSMNAITYKEVFPLIQKNKIWLGVTGYGKDMIFGVPKGAKVTEANRQKAARHGYIGDYTRLGNSYWFTNLDYRQRHEELELRTMKNNLLHSRHKEICGKKAYDHYDNYKAIEVPFTDAIPSDYDGVMGVPISFLEKHCPTQFDILGATESEGRGFSNGLWLGGVPQATVNGRRVYKRIFIQSKGGNNNADGT